MSNRNLKKRKTNQKTNPSSQYTRITVNKKKKKKKKKKGKKKKKKRT